MSRRDLIGLNGCPFCPGMLRRVPGVAGPLGNLQWALRCRGSAQVLAVRLNCWATRAALREMASRFKAASAAGIHNPTVHIRCPNGSVITIDGKPDVTAAAPAKRSQAPSIPPVAFRRGSRNEFQSQVKRESMRHAQFAKGGKNRWSPNRQDQPAEAPASAAQRQARCCEGAKRASAVRSRCGWPAHPRSAWHEPAPRRMKPALRCEAWLGTTKTGLPDYT